MKIPPLPANELDRLKALESYSIMDSLPEKEFDALTQLASYICGTPIALVSLLDEDRQWFKSSVGLDVSETPRDISFCQYAIMGDEVYEVDNALENELFANNPLVTGDPNIRYYAGAPLRDSNGINLGSLCVIDTKPNKLSEEQKKALTILADQVMVLLCLREKNDEFQEIQKEFQNFIELSKDMVCIANVDCKFIKVNPAFTKVLGYSKEDLEGEPFTDFIHPEDLEKTYKEVEKLSHGNKTISFENRYRTKKGQYLVLSWNASPDPETGNLYCIARDMTIEKQREKEILDITSDLTAILNASEFSMIATELDGTIKEFNRGAELLLGYKAEEVIGKASPAIFHVLDEVMKRSEDLTIELGEKVELGFATFVAKACKSGVADSHEWTYVRKDGSSFPVQLSVTAIKSVLGEVTGYLGIAKDITKEKEAEVNLLNSNNLLDESQSIAKTGSWKFDLITKDLIWSKGNYKIFEFEELPANRLYAAYRKLLRPETLARLDKAIEKSVSTGQNFEFLTDITFSDNRVKYILTLGQLIKNEFGEIVAAQGSTQDITEKTLAEQNLINSNTLLDESQRIAKIGSWKFNTITKDLMLSKGHSTIFELDGVPADQLYNAYRARIHDDDLAKLDEFDKNVIKTGEDYKTNYRILFPDNRIKYIQEIGQPFKNEKGEIIGLQGSILDVTQKTLAEQKIAEKAKEINDVRSALDESAIVTIADRKGIITFVNDKFCSVSQYDRDELIGHYHYVGNPEYQLNKFVKNIWTTIASGKVWKGDIKNRAKDGSYYWVDSTIVPFLDDKGKPYQYIAISSDITEQKLAKENLNSALVDLEKKNKELDQFAYIVSHDLKAPLRAINNLSEWIVEDMPDMPEMVSDNFGLLRGRVQRMENLINGVLDYSRIGRTKIEKEPVDTKQMLDQIAETLLPNKDFEISIAENFPVITAANILLYQVFSNLISNAVKYNDKPFGKVECFYESITGFHQFTVSDNGPGIAEEYHKKVFKVFQTIEARDKKESTGIGLSIVQKIIEEKGGNIRIESEENKGASFIFTLPK
ncbi:MAG TPA: PAS domain S-box protein [Flavobacterium sp.]|uniref:PAS domain S-box protein n=1 Tax=Flavobacterium sp. TaxID=239 RepID=UPI002F3F60FF